MLKASLVGMALVLAATGLATAKSRPVEHRPVVTSPEQAPLVEGRSAYVAPSAGDPVDSLRMGSYARELQEEESISNLPAN